MLTFLTNKLSQIGAIILALVIFVVATFRSGKEQQKTVEKYKDLEEYKETRDRIDETVVNTDVSDALDRLSKNGQLRD